MVKITKKEKERRELETKIRAIEDHIDTANRFLARIDYTEMIERIEKENN